MTTTASAQGVGIEDERASRDILDIAQICKDLFIAICTSSSDLVARADLQQQRFYVWASYLGVFAPFNASLDKRLQYSDEIRALVVKMLSVLQRNLEFLASTDHDVSVDEKVTSPSGLEGTPSEALEAIQASINRLKRLGATIRKYSVSCLDERVNAFTQRHGDENYSQLAKQVVRFKYKTATPSLQEQLALSMSSRRQRLRYLHRHQSKLAHVDITPTERTPETKVHSLPSLSPIGEDTEWKRSKHSQPPMRKALALRRHLPGRSPMHGGRSETNASKFVPTPSAIARLRRGDGASVVSSSKKSSTFMAEAPEKYPDPPKCLPDEPEPPCPYCCQPLGESERQGAKWVHHVNKDLCPFICLSDKCAQGPHNFPDLSTWAKHMRDAHTTKWPQLIHKPFIWACDVDHDVEEFFEEGQFQQHLDSQHLDCTNEEKHAIAESCQIPRKRERNVCPICGYDLSNSEDSIQGDPKIQALDEFGQLDLMAKHVAGHLRQLAFDSSKNLDEQAETTSETSLITSEADLADRDSRARRPSGADPLDDMSLEFPSMETDLPPQESLNSFDGQWASAEIEILFKIPDGLSSSAVQEWSEVLQELSRSTDADLNIGAPDPILKHFESREKDKRLSELQEILRPTPFPEDFFTTFNKQRVAGTGDWLLEDEDVQAWLEGNKPFLWITGAPGTGKSFLMTRLLAWGLDHLPRIAYFYFQDNQTETRSVLQALCDIAYQISQNDALYARELLKFVHSNDSIRTISNAVRSFLIEPFEEHTRGTTTYIFLDGIDEANRDEFEELLSQLNPDNESSRRPVNCKLQIALTGRSDMADTVTNYLESELFFIRLVVTRHITPDRCTDDVKSFITDSVLHMRSLESNSDDYKEQVIDAVANAADGLFILAKLLLAEVAVKRHPRSILESLKSPKTINGMFIQSLRSFSESPPHDIAPDLNEILQWVACAEKPLTLGQLMAVLTLKFGDPPFALESHLRGRYSCFFELKRQDGMTTDDLSRAHDRLVSPDSRLPRREARPRNQRPRTPANTPHQPSDILSPDEDIASHSDKATTQVSFFHNCAKTFFSTRDSTTRGSSADAPSLGFDPFIARVHVLKTCLSIFTNVPWFEKHPLGDTGESIREYAALCWQGHLAGVNPDMIPGAEKRDLGLKIFKMLTDNDAILQWSLIFNREHTGFEVLADYGIDNLRKWMGNPAALASLPDEARTWVSNEVDKSPGILRPLGELYARAWLSEDFSLGISALFCFQIVQTIALMEQGLTWSEATTKDMSVDKGILVATEWANIKETAHYRRRIDLCRNEGQRESNSTI
ncbi:hypothetical protein ACHAPT_009171 [Fusarium lateritium]